MKKEIKKPAIAFVAWAAMDELGLLDELNDELEIKVTSTICALLDGIFTSCDLYNNEQVLNLLNEAYKASEEIKEEKSNVIYINRPIETR